MILELPEALARLARDVIPAGARITVAKVQTTRPLYLLFGERASYPLCVVQFGPEQTIARLARVLRRLHDALPDAVPGSLACAAWDGHTWVHVQSGLAGTPWFRLRERVRTVSDWLLLRSRALRTLHAFQSAVREERDWASEVDAEAELMQQVRASRANGYALGATTAQRIEQCATRLRALGVSRLPWQHGDFCFNNLLVSERNLGLIDFEEFGATAVPLHDEFSLALSAHDFMSALPGSPRLGAHISECIHARSDLVASGCVEGLLFHHFLFRLNQCSGRPRRAAMADALAGHIENLARQPASYLESEVART